MVRALAALTCAVACKKEAAPATEAAEIALSTVPGDVVYAASSAIRVVDVAKGTVVAKIALEHTIYDIAFAAGGKTAFVATGAGVFELDTASNEASRLTDVPASAVFADDASHRLSILQHEVIVHENGTRDIEPFHMQVLDLSTRRLLDDEELGPSIMYAAPKVEGRRRLLATWKNELSLDGKPVPLDMIAGRFRIRPGFALTKSRAFVPVESPSASMVLVIDLAPRAGDPSAVAPVSSISLGRPLQLRGLAVTPDEKTLLVNAISELVLVDLSSREVKRAIELPGPQTGLVLGSGGRVAYLAQTVDGTGGALTMVAVDPLRVLGKLHFDDLSPWALAVRP